MHTDLCKDALYICVHRCNRELSTTCNFTCGGAGDKKSSYIALTRRKGSAAQCLHHIFRCALRWLFGNAVREVHATSHQTRSPACNAKCVRREFIRIKMKHSKDMSA